MSTNRKRIGIVGARGHTGAELIRLIAAHPVLELAFVSSRELDGQRVDAHVSEYRGELCYSAPAHEDLPKLGADVVVLALPNGKAEVCVAAFDAAGVDPLIVDLSADYRFDAHWYYGLPELTRDKWRGDERGGQGQDGGRRRDECLRDGEPHAARHRVDVAAHSGEQVTGSGALDGRQRQRHHLAQELFAQLGKDTFGNDGRRIAGDPHQNCLRHNENRQ